MSILDLKVDLEYEAIKIPALKYHLIPSLDNQEIRTFQVGEES